MENLTDIQRKVMEFILSYIKSTNTSPTLREIAANFNWKSVGSAQDVVAALRKKGLLLSINSGKARQIVPAIQKKERPFFPLKVPILGKAQAGFPTESYENTEDHIFFPNIVENSANKRNFFALKIEGYSMINAGLLPNDIILVEKEILPKDKDIVVASVNSGEITVKRFAKQGSALYATLMTKEQNFSYIENNSFPPAFLVPENPEFQAISFGNFETDKIIGVVISMYRKKI